MEEKDGVVTKVEGLSALNPLNSSTIAVAINGKKKSKYVVSWALDKFVPEGKVCFKLLHVRPCITGVPTPMGNSIPISQVRDDVVAAFRKDVEWQTSEKLHPYKMLCTRLKVQVEVVQLESDDIVEAIAHEVSKLNIIKLVIGASSWSIFSRGQSLSSRISDSIPSFCTIYAVSRGKLLSIRPSNSEINGSSWTEDSNTSCSISTSTGHSSSLLTEKSDLDSSSSYSQFRSPSLPIQRFQALSNINQNFPHRRAISNEIIHHKNYSLDFGDSEDDVSSCPQRSFLRERNNLASSFRSLVTDFYTMADDQASTSGAPTDLSLRNEVDINFELEKLRTELRHTQGMYAVAQTEVLDASRKMNELQNRRLEEEIKLQEISLKEEEAKDLVRKEKEEYKAAKREADYVKDCAEREAALRKEAELLALREAKEKDKLENALTDQAHQYQEFTWEEIVSSTSSFAENLKIGVGAYGTVYKCSLRHTTVAVKVLHSKSKGSDLTKQFQQELKILSKIRHPHLLILLGVCPDRGCLVYEFMENGSLEERLFRKHDTPPIPWFDRYRIAWEVASALAFLHNSKPDPIIHRDLKPANILLDRNFVSKIGDVGLSTMINSDAALSTIYRDTGPVGTLCYIDPEYQRTGMISPKSDVYAFGMVLLQLLTAKAPMGLPHIVETAIDKDSLTKVLDSKAGEWPLEETKKLAALALKCTEICRRDRPDLKEEILPALEKLKEVANKARDSASTTRPPPPTYYLCPLLKDVMEEPCVAADGYTYDRKAIETWLKDNDISPMTNLPLPHKNLLPNYALLSAILDWKSRKAGNI
ncbi:U-box domain-containing protein 35-like [Nicotiana sylvestris]|uniref:RING-type E3 ubiquitin transferase n=1 Tax=Nicotiana sylvestris TaxID=4096 RepID=A0A1U7WAT7_NICSY|nr:PREDICTED: U-box domain-containing protein 35-like [Nicotiana sylvestris]XP_009771775.1 PREDICTED: U-box domain-containing protein 35-like [Nicotiana sylvestris]XP_009771776.1 PREDICTED: U-box domain-containing protein 35-like [Nicotiana sylvestris]XP_009771777.1 PREDICTED: U-box domain-containing protein 35-like [Nicotiana sylvestris]